MTEKRDGAGRRASARTAGGLVETMAFMLLPVLLVVGMASSASAAPQDGATACAGSTTGTAEPDCTAPAAPDEPAPDSSGPTVAASDASLPRSDDSPSPGPFDAATASSPVGSPSGEPGLTMALAADQAQFVVVFDANGGSGSMDPQVGDGPAALSAGAYARPGYTFAGWNTSADGTGLAMDDGEVYAFDADLTLFAQWVPFAQFVVVFDANGGVGSMGAQVSSEPAPLSAAAFTRPGYTFIGWNVSPDGSGLAMEDGEVFAFDSDLTLFAQWVPLAQFVVVFDANGGVGSMDVQVSSEPAPLNASVFTRAGFTFAGWNNAPDGTGLAVADEEVVAFDSDLTLFAMWEPVPVSTLTVRHVVEGTETDLISAEISTIVVGDQYVAQTASFDGYELVGLRPDSAPATGVMGEGESLTVVFEYRAVDTLPGETETPPDVAEPPPGTETPATPPAGTEELPGSESSQVAAGSAQVVTNRRAGAPATGSRDGVASTSTGLPVTGSGLAAASVALVMLAAGTSLLIVSRKRREQASPVEPTEKLG